jgi:hypothetical protein
MSSHSQSEYSCGLHLLNMYLTSTASNASGLPVTFSGLRKSVMRLQALPADRRYCTPLNRQMFTSIISFFETFYRDRGGGTVHAHVLMQRARSFIFNADTLSSIVNNLIKDDMSSSPFRGLGQVFAGFLTLAELVAYHACDRYSLDIIAKCADMFLSRCMQFVIIPNGGWTRSLSHFRPPPDINCVSHLDDGFDIGGHGVDTQPLNVRRTAQRCTLLHRFFKFFRLV